MRNKFFFLWIIFYISMPLQALSSQSSLSSLLPSFYRQESVCFENKDPQYCSLEEMVHVRGQFLYFVKDILYNCQRGRIYGLEIVYKNGELGLERKSVSDYRATEGYLLYSFILCSKLYHDETRPPILAYWRRELDSYNIFKFLPQDDNEGTDRYQKDRARWLVSCIERDFYSRGDERVIKFLFLLWAGVNAGDNQFFLKVIEVFLDEESGINALERERAAVYMKAERIIDGLRRLFRDMHIDGLNDISTFLCKGFTKKLRHKGTVRISLDEPHMDFLEYPLERYEFNFHRIFMETDEFIEGTSSLGVIFKGQFIRFIYDNHRCYRGQEKTTLKRGFQVLFSKDEKEEDQETEEEPLYKHIATVEVEPFKGYSVLDMLEEVEEEQREEFKRAVCSGLLETLMIQRELWQYHGDLSLSQLCFKKKDKREWKNSLDSMSFFGDIHEDREQENRDRVHLASVLKIFLECESIDIKEILRGYEQLNMQAESMAERWEQEGRQASFDVILSRLLQWRSQEVAFYTPEKEDQRLFILKVLESASHHKDLLQKVVVIVALINSDEEEVLGTFRDRFFDHERSLGSDRGIGRVKRS